MPYLTNIHLVGNKLTCVYRWTDVSKLIGAFCDHANTHDPLDKYLFLIL